MANKLDVSLQSRNIRNMIPREATSNKEQAKRIT